MRRRYVPIEPVGQGSQGVLYKARDRGRGDVVALKVFVRDPERLHRKEIKALQKLPPHPHVVRIREAGEFDGCPAVAMDWLEGRSLRRVVDEDPIPRLEQVQRWSSQLALALAHCHRHHVIHRDVKPSNVMIVDRDDVILVDFGIAGFTDTQPTNGPAMGTFAYMAPERWGGAPGDPRSDLYGLGCVLYELLTGRPPFGDARLPEAYLRRAHREERPAPPSSRVAGVPQALDELTLALLAKNPADRPASAMEVAATLAEVLRTNSTTPDPHVDTAAVGDLHHADERVRDLAARFGPGDTRTLDARRELADLIGHSGDARGALRQYEEIIAISARVNGPYAPDTLRYRKASARWHFLDA